MVGLVQTIKWIILFFETFPVVLVDREGIVKVDVPFSRAKSKYSVEQVGVKIELYGRTTQPLKHTTIPGSVEPTSRCHLVICCRFFASMFSHCHNFSLLDVFWSFCCPPLPSFIISLSLPSDIVSYAVVFVTCLCFLCSFPVVWTYLLFHFHSKTSSLLIE